MTYTCDSSTWGMKTRTESVQSLAQSCSDFEDSLSLMGLNMKTNQQTSNDTEYIKHCYRSQAH